ncbi:alpha-mannosidase [Nocardiopsis suaedae]|uniref:Glycosyl hydrolase-related protein n=1 Tax=Nocardiopsis suaedae TaxID=3018444 RepID=A0ABT4TGK6_9ACTN|nr:glycoside hydrolase family 38 C-terminal domain-containing protein [Nocardiopsis suaedae]MDA2803843.1 glycosyl hydrolase-related protein [Nocardiopsis suaedae]
MHDDRQLVEDRVSRVLEERIRPAVHPERVPMEVARWDAPGEPVPVAEGLAAPYRPARTGEPWGPPWATTWFRLRGRVPGAWAGRTVEALVDLGFDERMPGFQCEGLAYTADGAVVKGLSPRNRWLRAASSAQAGQPVEYFVEAAANPVVLGVPPFRPTELGDRRTAHDRPLYRVESVDLAVLDHEVWHLVHDIEVLDQMMRELPEGAPRRWEVLRALERALDAVDLQDVPGTAEAARRVLAPVLASPAEAGAHRVSAVGHAHIDSAWLWPLRETVRKVARTAANVTALMDDHPGLVFAMSQAQQLAWIKEHRPEVYTRVKEKAAEGRFVPVGGMWVEADTNMPGGEAMARQFVFGKRFFAEEFGVDTKEVWLPDSFGYSAALPQIVRLAGAEWFLTQKISWNRTNPFPHHTFQWEGIDGTRVFTHFPPVDTYNSDLSGRELAHAVRNFRDKGGASRSLVPFGWGDGGGGPTREMLGRADRLADLEGSPRVRLERPDAFFAAAREDYPDPPVWLGELYLELHRATYTSQARTKQGNRRSEHLLREAELWAATAAVHAGAPYPYERLEGIWKRVLLHQFHDILPGTSIAWVHREAAETYEGIARELEEVIGGAQAALLDAAPGPGGPDAPAVFNACPHERDGVPALGAGPATRAQDTGGAVRHTLDGDAHVLDNGLVRAVVGPDGLLLSVVDLSADGGRGREALAPGGRGNLLQIHPDFPNMWDAWDVDSFYRNTVTDLDGADDVSAEPLEGGAWAVTARRSFGSSTAVQRTVLRPGAARVDMETEVDWREAEKFLKAAFPLDVRADEAASEIQFGHVRRPAHTNTSWDAARFETCAHRWIRVADPDYGHALVNDSTYGHDVTRDVRGDGGTTTAVRLSLLRAPRFPDPRTDHGVHRFGYALVPGAAVADAVREGYRINLPERTAARGGSVAPLVRVEEAGVVVEAVKLADDRSGDVVVRLYEARGARASTRVGFGFAAGRPARVDLLERPLEGATAPVPDGDGHRLELRPFEIATLRVPRTL